MSELLSIESVEAEKCDQCKKEFENGEQLRVHIERTHNVNQVAKKKTGTISIPSTACDVCKLNCENVNNLTTHMSTAHPTASVAKLGVETKDYVLDSLKALEKKL